MKKIVKMIVLCHLFSVCFSLLSACSSHHVCEPVIMKTYNVLECDYSDSVSGANHKVEYDYWTVGRHIDTNIEKERQIMLDKNVTQGVYQYSQHQMPNNYPTHIYKDAKGTRFATDPDGFPVFFFWGNRQTDTPSLGVHTEQQCLSVARDFLSNYADVDEYEITTKTDSDKGIYEFTFTKWLNSYRTTDSATIVVKNDGSLYSYSSFMLGRLPTSADVEFNPDVAKQSVYQKLDTIYSPVRANYSAVTYGTPNFEYTILENGDLAILCVVDIQCENSNGGGICTIQSEKVALIIEL